MISSVDDAVEALYDLNVGVVGKGADRHERPHKPLLLLTILDLIATGIATPNRIAWAQELRAQFSVYFNLVRSHNDQCTPENPFLYLKQDGIWEPFRLAQNGTGPLESPPTIGDASSGSVYARLVGGTLR